MHFPACSTGKPAANAKSAAGAPPLNRSEPRELDSTDIFRDSHVGLVEFTALGARRSAARTPLGLLAG